MTTVDEAIAILNTILEADPKAIEALVQHRVGCNTTLADHPTVQVGKNDSPGGEVRQYTVGLLGIINGLFGVDQDGWGYIATEYSDGGHILLFRRTPERGQG